MSLRPDLFKATILAGMGLAVPALAQTIGQANSPEIAWWRVVASLLLCLALGVAGANALRARFGGQLRPVGQRVVRRLRVVENLRIGHQVDVCLVACDEAEFIVAASPHGIAMTPVVSPERAESA
jgi:hypothetical protein